MFTTLTVRRLGVGTVYKLWFIGMLASMLPLGLLFGVLAAFGYNTVTWNGEPLYGVAGLVSGPLMGLFLAVRFTLLLGSAAALGLWLYSKLRPSSRLTERSPGPLLISGRPGADARYESKVAGGPMFSFFHPKPVVSRLPVAEHAVRQSALPAPLPQVIMVRRREPPPEPPAQA